MAKTYEDTQGRTFSTYDEALASNQEPLTSSTLAPVKQIELATPKPTTQSDGALAFLGQTAQQGADAYTKRLEMESSRDDYLSSLISAPTESGAQLQANESYGVNTAETELNDINNQILAEQVALQRRLEALDKNESGLFGGALEQEKQKVKDESLKRQADLSVVQLSKQGRYDSARAIADRAVSALMERTYRDIEVRRTIYEDYKDLFNTAEQRAYESAEAEREREANNREFRLRADYEQQIRQNDPAYQLDLAHKQAQIDKTYAEIEKVKSETGAKDDKALARIQDRVNQAEVVIGKVGEALKGVTNFSTGFIGGTTKSVPGTSAYVLNSALDTIKANLGFDELQAMREASPTGGALGQVAVQELNMLQATIASLDTGLDSGTLTANLNQVVTHYRNWLNTIGYELAPDGAVIEITD